MNDFLKKIAPTLAAFLGSPAAGVAVELLSNALNVTEPEVEARLSAPLSSADIAAIRQAEIAAKAKEQELGIRAEELLIEDRKSAREMYAQTRAITPQLLSWLVVAATIWLEGYVLLYGIPAGANDLVVGRVLGTLDMAFGTVLAFWLGSSHGSTVKTEMLKKAD